MAKIGPVEVEAVVNIAHDPQPIPMMVIWRDSGMQISEPWASTEVYKSYIRDWNGEVTSVGMLLHEDDSVLVLGLSYDPAGDHWFSAQLIYKPDIIERRVLRPA